MCFYLFQLMFYLFQLTLFSFLDILPNLSIHYHLFALGIYVQIFEKYYFIYYIIDLTNAIDKHMISVLSLFHYCLYLFTFGFIVFIRPFSFVSCLKLRGGRCCIVCCVFILQYPIGCYNYAYYIYNPFPYSLFACICITQSLSVLVITLVGSAVAHLGSE